MSFGRVSWPPEAPVWTFLWEVAQFDSEGIAFRDVFFKGKKVFHKASLPMIRVQYNTPGNGPYKDALSGGNMQGGVTVREGAPGAGSRFLVVESYHRIGHYRITNRWIFRSDGIVLPQLYSAGLQHPDTHRHHVYYRFDFDIDGQASDLVLWHLSDFAQDVGFGPGWVPLRNEGQFTKTPAANTWAVLNKPNFIGYTIKAGPFDGVADAFSRNDLWVALYHGPEDVKGRLGRAFDDQLSQHINNENTDGQDVVVWYCAHLQHIAADNGDEWHVCGPILAPFGY